MKLILLLTLATNAINGCQTFPDPDIVQRAMCEQFTYITYSRHDTEETVHQIGLHNKLMEALCPAK